MKAKSKPNPVSRRPSAVKTNQILENAKKRAEIGRRNSMMSQEELDRMYVAVSEKLKSEAEATKNKVDTMQARSSEIDHHFNSLRELNKEDLAKTERRLSRLNIELKSIEESGIVMFDEETNTKHSPLTSRRATVHANKLSGLFSNSNLLEGVPELRTEEDSEESSLSNSDEDSPPPPPPPLKVLTSSTDAACVKDEGTAGRKLVLEDLLDDSADIVNSSEISVLKRDDGNNVEPMSEPVAVPEEISPQLPPVPPVPNVSGITHERVFDETRKRHYFVDVRSGVSVWSAPPNGVILCCDNKTGRYFVTDTKTGKPVWRPDITRSLLTS